MKNKTDAEVFVQVIKELKQQSWLGSRKWWPDAIFHFTDVNNAANILKAEKMYSRNYLLNKGGMVTDNASPTIIQGTDERSKDFVRFYFRPKTPTQYRNEGFRPVVDRALGGAHCPVPVFFLFDSLPMLCRADSSFTYGNLASNPIVYTSGQDFRTMPFKDIYHEGYFDRDTESHITFHRQAELLIPNECDLASLRFVVCRSTAERETLLKLLPDITRRKWEKKIIINPHANLFFGDWAYIDKITSSADKVVLNFHVGPKIRNHFAARFVMVDKETGKQQFWEESTFKPPSTFTLRFETASHHYLMKFYLDQQLAYYGEYIDEDLLPF